MKSSLRIVCMLLVFTGCQSEAVQQVAEALPVNSGGVCEDLSGSWEMISMTVTTPDTSYTQDETEIPTLKVLNETHWMFIRQSADEFVFAQGGPYHLEEGAYTEIVGYSAEPGNIDQEYSFNCRIEGDSLWYHEGNLGGGTYVDEIWRRVH